MAQHVGYWIDLQGKTFAEGEAAWIQAFPLGTYKHSLYGKIVLTAKKALQFAYNVNQGVRGQELDIDYDHKEYSGKAAGWIKAAEARPDGLWIKVEFTADATKAIKAGEYRYFSPEYVDTWTNPKTGATYKDVLFGGALTNRPFLKDILPINMSEIADGKVSPVDEFLEKLRKTLKLSEEATEEEILAAAEEAAKEETEPKKEETEPKREEEEEPEIDEAKLSELIKSNPLVAVLLKQNKKLTEQVGQIAHTLKESEASAKLNEWSAPAAGRKYGLPPAVHDDLRKVMLSEEGADFGAVVDQILKTGLVKLTEEGGDSRSSTKGGGGSATKKFTEAVAEKMKLGEGKIDYVTASGMVAQEDEDLFEAYRQEALEGTSEVN